jgi:hypothetical protein
MPSICANVKRKIPHFYYIFAPGAQSGEVPLSAHVFSSDVILYVCEFSKREIIPILYNIPQHLLRVAAQPPSLPYLFLRHKNYSGVETAKTLGQSPASAGPIILEHTQRQL